MLPVVKEEVFQVVKTQFQGETFSYLERMMEKLKSEQPILHQYFVDQNIQFVQDMCSIEDEETRNTFAIMNVISMPIMVYEMLRNQAEADDMNALLS